MKASIVKSDNEAKLWERLSFDLSWKCYNMLGLMWTHLAKADIERQDQEHTLSLSWHVQCQWECLCSKCSWYLMCTHSTWTVLNIVACKLLQYLQSHISHSYLILLHSDIYLRAVPVIEEPEDEDDTKNLDSKENQENVYYSFALTYNPYAILWGWLLWHMSTIVFQLHHTFVRSEGLSFRLIFTHPNLPQSSSLCELKP